MKRRRVVQLDDEAGYRRILSCTTMPGAAQLLEPVREYLSEPRCAVLSTLGLDGAPRQVVVHYRLEPGHLMVNGRSDRRWAENLRRDPRVSVVVHDADDPLHWVGLRGAAELVADDSSAVDDAVALARRYGEDPTPYESQSRVSFRIVPERVFEYR